MAVTRFTRWISPLFLGLLYLTTSNLANADIPVGHFTDVKPVFDDDAHRDFHGVTSADGLTLIFANSNDRGSGSNDLWMATRLDSEQTFGEVVRLGPDVNSSAFEDLGSVSLDGQTLYFSSNREGKWQSYQATRNGDLFDNVTSIGPAVNAGVEADGPKVSADGLTLYYHRAERLFSTREQVRIWMATRPSTDAPFGDPEDLGDDLNGPPGSSFEQWYPSISGDETVLFFSDVTFASSPPRPEGKGSADIWVSTRSTPDDSFGTPVNINDLWPGSEINTASSDGMPYISSDWPAPGAKLYFVRDTANAGIYQAT